MVFVAAVSWLTTEQPLATSASTASHSNLPIRNPKSEIRNAKLAVSSSEFKITVLNLRRKSKRRQAHNESRALAFCAHKSDAASVKLDTASDNRKPQARAGDAANVGAAMEGSEQILSIGFGYTDAFI